MNLKNFLLYMIIITIICWLGFLMIIYFINPQEAGGLAFLLFYFILGLSVTGTFTIIVFLLRKIFHRQELAFDQVLISFRQGIWISLLLIIALYLQSRLLLTWWNGILLVLSLALIEFFCLNYKISN